MVLDDDSFPKQVRKSIITKATMVLLILHLILSELKRVQQYSFEIYLKNLDL